MSDVVRIELIGEPTSSMPLVMQKILRIFGQYADMEFDESQHWIRLTLSEQDKVKLLLNLQETRR